MISSRDQPKLREKILPNRSPFSIADFTEALGVAQQTMAHYEAGRLRLLAGALPTLAEHLGVTVEELVGAPPAKRTAGKRGPQPKIAQQLERIQSLPAAEQRAIVKVLDSVLAAHQ